MVHLQNTLINVQKTVINFHICNMILSGVLWVLSRVNQGKEIRGVKQSSCSINMIYFTIHSLNIFL